MMIRVPAPPVLNGAILSNDLAAAGIPQPDVVLIGDEVQINTGEASRAVVESVVANHASAAQAALDSAADERDNRSSIQAKAAAALQANRDFLALASPTNAQAVAQIRALSRQNNGLIRLILRRFEGTD